MCSVRYGLNCGNGILGNGLAAFFEGLDEPDEGAEIVKDPAICEQVVVFDGLPLFVAAVFHDDPFASEEGPLEEAIEGLALVGGPWIVERKSASES
jgi:hypothetical protein